MTDFFWSAQQMLIVHILSRIPVLQKRLVFHLLRAVVITCEMCNSLFRSKEFAPFTHK